MSKILAVSDIHINDYANRNPSNRFRLYQGSRIVAQNIIEVGKKEGCDYIVLAGDIIEKSVIRPYVQAEVKYFLDTIMANFKEGFIIWGNHDLDSKSIDQDISDACLGVMLPENLYYAHQKIINLDGVSIGFSNWMPEFNLNWIQDKVDVLFTHATICYNQDVKDGKIFESQKLDESKFDLAICGDIHRIGQKGKYVSIGVPQRCKLGDSEDSTGVVLDLNSKQWKWVNLNPHDNLMKFDITDNLEKEGWDQNTHTWLIYKQENNFIDDSGKIKVDTWEEINDLVNQSISSSGLEYVHQEILKNISNIDAGEVDFNFTLTHLHCENWRSIKVADIDFTGNDKILIQGSNGSGKSSILSAIKYAFVDCSDTTGLLSLKVFTSFGEKDCFTCVDFLYQGNNYRLLRGTSNYGLWINGEQMKYNDKRTFEKDARERLPFIKYMDAFFFDADKNSFLKSLSPERITEITSKFLKLNRIDTYNETARNLYDQYRTSWNEWNIKLKETEKLVSYINEKLNNINLPSINKDKLISLKQEGLEIQRKNKLWNDYVNCSSRLQGQLQIYNEKLDDLNKKSLNFRNIEIIDQEITNLENQISENNNNLLNLNINNIITELDYKTREYENLRTEGNNAYKEAMNLNTNKICSMCGQVISNTEALNKHKQELMQKVEDIKPKIIKIKEEISNLAKLKDNLEPEYNNLKNIIKNLNSEVSNKMTEKNIINNTRIDINNTINQINKVNTELNNLGVVERVDLPENFMQKMTEVESGINAWNSYETTYNDKLLKEQDLIAYKNKVDNLEAIMKQLDTYAKLTGPTGTIFEEIFKKLAKQFSNNTFKYQVERKGKGNKEHLSIVPYFNNSGNFVNIFMASSGQRIMLDIDYLSKIIGSSQLGLLVLDEFLKPLDSERLEIAIEMLKDINVNCMLLTSHAESLSAFYNRSLLMSLDDNGKTNILVK